MANFGIQNKRFTIYDGMAARGVFASNPANVGAVNEQGEQIYRGPVEYPKMFYHPTGEEEVIRHGTWEDTKLGPKYLGEQTAIISRMAKSEEEEKILVGEGWHDHPAKAIIAGNKIRSAEGKPLRPVPPMGSDVRAKELASEVSGLQAELERLKAQLAERDAAERKGVAQALGPTRSPSGARMPESRSA